MKETGTDKGGLSWGKVSALAALILLPAFTHGARAAETSPAAATVRSGADNLSFQNEIQNAIDRGLAWLKANQHPEGWWSTPDQPAVTALPVIAFNGDPLKRYQGKSSPELQKAYKAILSQVKPDGGIYSTNLVTYNTAICLMGLLSANDQKFDEPIRDARKFLVGLQTDLGEKGKVDNEFDGGFGYGTKNANRSDLANTVTALEALYYSKRFAADQPGQDLNWQAAIQFLQKCQNLPGTNPEPWASGDSTNRGGFVYYPGRSMAGAETNSVTGKIALRSYGTMTYAGLLSYIYANLEKDDTRVKAALDWLAENYTLEENPGMGKAGLYYYYHLMAKALTTAGVEKLHLDSGKDIDWTRDLALKLMALQERDGSWVNENVRWWEKDPNLVTAYSVLALEFVWRSLNG